MVLELAIIPRGSGSSSSNTIADLVKIIESSGLDYQMTAFGTLLEGTWDQLMDIAKRCHVEARSNSKRVLTLMRIDDYGDRTSEIRSAVSRVEEKLGHPVKK